MSQHWLPRGALNMQGFGVFSEGRKGSLLSMLWFFPGLKLGAIKISEKTSKNCIIWEIKGIFERPFLLRYLRIYLRIYLQSLFFFMRQNWATVQDAISGVGSHGSWQDAFQRGLVALLLAC